jgi:hypothetical protein
MDRHEIPTHLNVEDKAFAGLTMRQLMTVAIGLALAYGAASEPPVPIPVRLALAGIVLAGTAVLTLWRPGGRPLEDWAFVLLRYWSLPRVAVWHPGGTNEDEHELQSGDRCEVILPEMEARQAEGDGGSDG